MTWDLVAVFLVVWVLSTSIIHAYQRPLTRWRTVADRLWPYQAPTLADEAHEWLSREPE